MIELALTRRPSLKKTTLGSLSIDGRFFCFTCEDEVREIKGKPVECWKEPGETAIPEGRYKVTLVDSGRFGRNTFSLEDVPGFSEIRIHSGNTAADTEGCILVGVSIDPGAGTIGQSRVALAKLKEILVPEILKGTPVFITVSC